MLEYHSFLSYFACIRDQYHLILLTSFYELMCVDHMDPAKDFKVVFQSCVFFRNRSTNRLDGLLFDPLTFLRLKNMKSIVSSSLVNGLWPLVFVLPVQRRVPR